MSPPTFRLTELPIETLEQVLQHLPGQDVIKMEVISRQFQKLIRDSPTLQCKRELFSVGLIEDPRKPCDFAQRRKLCEEHKRKWSNAGRVAKTIHELPEELSLEQHLTTTLGWGLIAYHNTEDGSLSFLRPPPVMSQKPIEWWTIPPYPFSLKVFVAYPPDDLLVVAEEKERFVRIHFLNLLDGSPYRVPPSNAIKWEFPQGVSDVSVRGLAITSSRVMMHVYCWGFVQPKDLKAERIFVWDWKTGDLILSLPSADGSTVVGKSTSVTFLDEFRMMVLTPLIAPDVLEFTLFDTFVSRGHPVNSRRFRLPQRYRDWVPSVHVDGDRCLGTPGRDRPFIADPTQAILVVKLLSRGPRVLLIVRIQTLIEHLRSMSADTYVPWDVWGRGVAVMEFPMRGRARGGPYPLVQGVRMIFVKMDNTSDGDGDHQYFHLRIFDLSRRGYSILPLWDGGSGTERKVSFEGGPRLLLQGDEEMVEWGFDPLCDGKFMYLSNSDDPGGALSVWEVI